MSSLNATQADGYYIPPDYLNCGAYKKKSVSKYNHPTSKGHNQYLKNNVVRFELPYDGFCMHDSCRCHIGKGTRFNAKKVHARDNKTDDNNGGSGRDDGNGKELYYFSTKIWEFQMKCRNSNCTQKFVIRTNPEKRCFDYISGIKKKMEEFDTVQNGSLGVIDTDYGHTIHNFTNGKVQLDGNLNEDVMSSSAGAPSAIDKLQKEIFGKRKAMSERDAMEMLLKHNNSTMYDDARSNSNLRAEYRVKRREKKRRVKEAKDLGLGRGILLGDTKTEDVAISRSAFDQKDVRDAKSCEKEKRKFQSIRKGIFVVEGKDASSLRKSNRKSNRLHKSVEGERSKTTIQSVARNDLHMEHTKEKKAVKILIQNGKLSSVKRGKICSSAYACGTLKGSSRSSKPAVSSLSLLALNGYGSDSS